MSRKCQRMLKPVRNIRKPKVALCYCLCCLTKIHRYSVYLSHKTNISRKSSHLRSWNIRHKLQRYCLIEVVTSQKGLEPLPSTMSSLFTYRIQYVIDSSSIIVKEAQKQRKEAKLIKQLEKQKQQETAEREELEQRQNKKGNVTIHSWIDR